MNWTKRYKWWPFAAGISNPWRLYDDQDRQFAEVYRYFGQWCCWITVVNGGFSSLTEWQTKERAMAHAEKVVGNREGLKMTPNSATNKLPKTLYAALNEEGDWFSDTGLEIFEDGELVGVYTLTEVKRKRTSHALVGPILGQE